MRRALLAAALCAGVAGCNAAGDPEGDATWSKAGVPFSFDYPARWTKASIDQGNTRGRVAGAVGLTKVDLIAVRRGGATGTRHERVLGHDVTSELHAVPGHDGWVLECQYTGDLRTDVRDACHAALRSVSAK